MAIFDEWVRLSARIHGLVKASELAGLLFEKNNDSLGAMVDLGKTAAAILSDLAILRARLGPTSAEVSAKIEAAESKARPLLSEVSATTQDMRQIYIRSALVVLASLEAEVTYLLSDHQASIQSRTERAFEHLQRSIVVDEQMGDRWRKAWEAGEVKCEKLGSVHLLSTMCRLRAADIKTWRVSARNGFTRPNPPSIPGTAIPLGTVRSPVAILPTRAMEGTGVAGTKSANSESISARKLAVTNENAMSAPAGTSNDGQSVS